MEMTGKSILLLLTTELASSRLFRTNNASSGTVPCKVTMPLMIFTAPRLVRLISYGTTTMVGGYGIFHYGLATHGQAHLLTLTFATVVLLVLCEVAAPYYLLPIWVIRFPSARSFFWPSGMQQALYLVLALALAQTLQ